MNLHIIKISRKTKIKSYEGKINSNFHPNKNPKESSQCICLSVILIGLFIEQVKAIILKYLNILLNKKKMPEYITDDIEISDDDSGEENSDKKISNKKN